MTEIPKDNFPDDIAYLEVYNIMKYAIYLELICNIKTYEKSSMTYLQRQHTYVLRNSKS